MNVTPARLAELIGFLQDRTDGGFGASGDVGNDTLAALRELGSARTRLEGVEADARRYRWLRDINDATYFSVREETEQSKQLYGSALDAAIDAALAQSAEQGESNVQEG